MLEDYLKSYDRITVFSLVPILIAPIVLDTIFALEPPWPRGSSYITGFLELAIIIVAFFNVPRSNGLLKRRQVIFLGVSVLMFASYFLMHSIFVFAEPTSGREIIGGFQCTEEAKRYVAPQLNQECPFLNDTVLAAAQYRADMVWTPLSIKLTEYAMFLVWSSFFLAVTYLLASSIAFAHQRRMIKKSGRVAG